MATPTQCRTRHSKSVMGKIISCRKTRDNKGMWEVKRRVPITPQSLQDQNYLDDLQFRRFSTARPCTPQSAQFVPVEPLFEVFFPKAPLRGQVFQLIDFSDLFKSDCYGQSLCLLPEKPSCLMSTTYLLQWFIHSNTVPVHPTPFY